MKKNRLLLSLVCFFISGFLKGAIPNLLVDDQPIVVLENRVFSRIHNLDAWEKKRYKEKLQFIRDQIMQVVPLVYRNEMDAILQGDKDSPLFNRGVFSMSSLKNNAQLQTELLKVQRHLLNLLEEDLSNDDFRKAFFERGWDNGEDITVEKVIDLLEEADQAEKRNLAVVHPSLFYNKQQVGDEEKEFLFFPQTVVGSETVDPLREEVLNFLQSDIPNAIFKYYWLRYKKAKEAVAESFDLYERGMVNRVTFLELFETAKNNLTRIREESLEALIGQRLTTIAKQYKSRDKQLSLEDISKLRESAGLNQRILKLIEDVMQGLKETPHEKHMRIEAMVNKVLTDFADSLDVLSSQVIEGKKVAIEELESLNDLASSVFEVAEIYQGSQLGIKAVMLLEEEKLLTNCLLLEAGRRHIETAKEKMAEKPNFPLHEEVRLMIDGENKQRKRIEEFKENISPSSKLYEVLNRIFLAYSNELKDAIEHYKKWECPLYRR